MGSGPWWRSFNADGWVAMAVAARSGDPDGYHHSIGDLEMKNNFMQALAAGVPRVKADKRVRRTATMAATRL